MNKVHKTYQIGAVFRNFNYYKSNNTKHITTVTSDFVKHCNQYIAKTQSINQIHSQEKNIFSRKLGVLEIKQDKIVNNRKSLA